MGVTIREKTKGSNQWWVFVNSKGRRTSRKVGTKSAAQKVAEKIQARLTLGESLPEKKPPAPKLEEYYQSRFKPYMKLTLKRSTCITFESNFRVHILPQFGRLPLDQVDRQKMEGFISKLVEGGMAKDSIRLILAALSSLYTHALDNKLVTENPARGVSKLYRQVPKRHKKPEPLTVEESLAFLSAALTHDPEHYPIFLLALHCGLRSSEIGGLQWGDISWHSRSISVRRAIVRGHVTTLKTESSERTVDCSDDLLRVLADLRRRRQKQALKSGTQLCPWVFTCRKGQPLGMNNVKARHFKRVLRKAGLRDLRFHDLRHSYASLLLAQGEPITYVANQLGHKNPGITLKIYSHWIPSESQQEAVNKLPSLSRQIEAIRSATN